MTSKSALLSQILTPSRRRWLLKLAQRRARRFGYSLVQMPARGAGQTGWDIWTWVRDTTDIKTVIDIGANDGQYTEYLNDYFKPAKVHAFEPLPACLTKLDALRPKIPHLTIHPLAASDEDGTATFYSNEFAPASSLLQVSDLAKRAFPETERASAATVKLARLDDVLDASTLKRDVLIKIDVQGVEDRVIRGGQAVFSAAKIVLIEMSFVPVYDGQPLFEEVHRLLEGCGLRLAGFKNQIDDAQTGQPLFAHCLYRRPDDAPAP
jgi:FkbM family methyltransferase